MSDVGTLITNLITDAEAAIAGLTTSDEAESVEELPPESFPYAALLQTGYDVSPLDWQQEIRTWTIAGGVWQIGGTRETMQTKLEAFRDQVNADPTVGGAVDSAAMTISVPESHSDARLIAGLFTVRAEQVV